jgi:multimeric flavodoxin WrbA
MDIALFNGTPKGYAGRLNEYVDELGDSLKGRGHTVSELRLRDLDLRYCTGCFGCFVKTPGRCLIRDDAEAVCRTYVQSDLVIMVSPVVMGFTSALLKRAQDRIIPLVLPYLEIFDGEMHHPSRYGKLPLMALLLEKGAGSDDEDLDIIRAIFGRIALNAHSKLAFTRFADRPAEEVCHAVDRI